MGTRILFVTCPTCREILPELPEIPLYKCGKCATIIQAENSNIANVTETNSVTKHGNSCRATGKDEGNYFVWDPCSTSESAHRNEKFPAEDEQPKGKESMYLSRQNNSNESCLNKESVHGPKVERASMMEQKIKVLDETNATRLEGSLNLEEGNETNAAPATYKESMLTESVPQYDSYSKETQKTLRNFAPPGSEEILEGLPNNPRSPLPNNPRSPLPNNPKSPIGSILKSPTKICNACDATNFKGSGDRSAYRPRLKGRSRFKKMQNGQLLTVNEPTASSSTSKVKNGLIAKGGDWKDSEVPGARKQGYVMRNNMREGNNDSDTHRMAYMTRSSPLPRENGSPSSIRRNVSHQYTQPHLPNSTFYDDPDKIKLLKKVYELEEMLKETHISKKMRNRRSRARVLGEKKHTPHYYDNLATVQNAYANVKNSGHYGNHSQGLRCTHQPKISSVKFSGEATLSRNHMDGMCSCCCHQCWHHTTKSCSHCIFSQHAIHPTNNYDNGNPSHSQRTQTHPNDKFFSQGFERKADDQLHQKKNVIKLCLRENYPTVRKHIRPVAGGAPIMACHYCSELLQLPAEHSLSNKQFYQLRCYLCERIMKLSLEKKVHLVPYLPTFSAPPPSEIDDCTHAQNN